MIWYALLLGTTGSLHCLGMCGPIAMMLPVHGSTTLKKYTSVISYHSGRLASYTLIGIVFGMVGKGLQLFLLQQGLSILIGFLMIVFALAPKIKWLGIPNISFFYKWVNFIKTELGHRLKANSNDAFLTLGFLNGFLPCGLVYVALAGALALGSVLEGGLFMALFGLGTVPLMTAMVFLGGRIKPKGLQKLRVIVPYIIVGMGVLLICRGLGLGIPFVSPMLPMEPVAESAIECP